MDKERRASAKEGEPLLTQDRSIVDMHGSLYVNLTELSGSVLNLEKGHTVEVETHEDRVVVKPKSD